MPFFFHDICVGFSIHSRLLGSCPTSCEPAWFSSMVAKCRFQQYKDTWETQKVQDCVWEKRCYKCGDLSWMSHLDEIDLSVARFKVCRPLARFDQDFEQTSRKKERVVHRLWRLEKFSVQLPSILCSSSTVVSGKWELPFHGHKSSNGFTVRKISDLCRTSEILQLLLLRHFFFSILHQDTTLS